MLNGRAGLQGHTVCLTPRKIFMNVLLSGQNGNAAVERGHALRRHREAKKGGVVEHKGGGHNGGSEADELMLATLLQSALGGQHEGELIGVAVSKQRVG
jgi:hypothetical protein